MVVILVILFAAIVITTTWYQTNKRIQVLSRSPIVKRQAYQLKTQELNCPPGVYVSPTHSWTHLEANGKAKVGIDAFLQGLTGVLSGIAVPEKGQFIRQGQTLFSLVHRGKKLVITAPVSGKITAINTEALQNMRLVHRNPFTFGWLLEMEPTDWEQDIHRLYLGERARVWLKSEIGRLRDFFAHALAEPGGAESPVLLQEGGEIAEEALGFAPAEIWEAFQNRILDAANQDLQLQS